MSYGLSEGAAVAYGQALVDARLIAHVVDRDKRFANDFLFFVFTAAAFLRGPDSGLLGRIAYAQRRVIESSTYRVAHGSPGLPFDTLDDIVSAARAFDGVSIERRTYLLRDYPACFVASEFVSWLAGVGLQMPRIDAVRIGQTLVDQGHMRHGKTRRTCTCSCPPHHSRQLSIPRSVSRMTTCSSGSRPTSDWWRAAWR